MVTHLKKSEFINVVQKLKGTTWSDIAALGYKRWFYFCRVTGRMWVLPLRYTLVSHGRWVVPSTKNVPHYLGGGFRGWGTLTDIENAPEADPDEEVVPPVGYEEVIIDDD